MIDPQLATGYLLLDCESFPAASQALVRHIYTVVSYRSLWATASNRSKPSLQPDLVCHRCAAAGVPCQFVRWGTKCANCKESGGRTCMFMYTEWWYFNFPVGGEESYSHEYSKHPFLSLFLDLFRFQV